MNKQDLFNNLKNIIGWHTPRKLVVFAVDDYGNVRVDSPMARERMSKAGLRIHNRFDALDTLETRQDLEALFETLNSVNDAKGKPAVFTPYALPCNINFEQLAEENYRIYRFETLRETFRKLSAAQSQAYEGAWELLVEGIKQGLFVPQFHGREHLNLTAFQNKLEQRDEELLTALKNRSYTSISSSGYPTISYTAAYSFWSKDELGPMHQNLISGLELFEQVFGYKATVFTPPAQHLHKSLESTLWQHGIKAIDKPLLKKRHQGLGKYKREIQYTRKLGPSRALIVRNVVFEPTEDRGFDWVAFTMKQIEAAFRWNRPAIISSHRVNFCGHIDEGNRARGLSALRDLLQAITKRWPEVEFISAAELTTQILASR